MAHITPPAPRARMTENNQELRVTVPARRDIFALVFISFWLVGWAFGEVTVCVGLLTGKATGAVDLLLLAWLLVWTCGGIWAVFNWCWNAKGHEEITVNGDTFAVRYSAFGIGRTWNFHPWAVRNVRVIENFVSPMPFWMQTFEQSRQANSKAATGIWHGPLAFDYGAKTYRFGAGMDEAEARDLLPHLLRRLSPDDPLPAQPPLG